MRKNVRLILLAVTTVVISVMGMLILAEVILQFLPVNQGLRAQAVDAESPVFRFEANRTAIWSEGWNFEIVNRVHVNNDGFVNNQDYEPDAMTPLLAIIGDSYIEAGMVPFAETVSGRLSSEVGGRVRVYSFAASGAGLTQYLVWANYARARYRPQAFVINIIANDFSESLWHRGQSPGFHHFERQADGTAVLRRVDYQPSFSRRMLRQSALAMYLVTNVKIQALLNFSTWNLSSRDRRWSANVPYESTGAELADYRWAVDRFLDALPESVGVEPSAVLLVLDGIRPDIYDPALATDAPKSTWGIMRRYVMDQARSRGFDVVDLQPIFASHYALMRQRFEYPHDGHWNYLGHELAVRAIEETPMFQRFRALAMTGAGN